MTETLTFDQEEALVRGQIPLNEFKEILKQQDETKIKTINFSRNGYCNDAVLKLIKSEKKKKYENLKKVCLDGCMLISNAGIKWLSDIIDGATQLEQIVLDGCINLSDDELSLLLKIVGSNCEVQMRGTSVCYLYSPVGKTIETLGCPLFTGMKSNEEAKFGHALVIPHDSVENSLAELIKTKKPSKRKPFHHVTDLDLNDWSIAISEMSIEHPMFDSMINNHQTAVIIPFDESAVIQEVKKHIVDTIAKVVTKTAFTTEYLQNKVDEEKKVRVDIEVDDFMTVQNVCKQHFHGDILGNLCYDDELLGCLLSRTPLTRSNPYFEAELVETKVLTDDGNVDSIKVVDPSEDSDDDVDDDGETKSGVLIGCLFNKLFSCFNPLEIDVDKGGEVSTFDFGKSKKFGFGIKGEWLSEYIPSSKASFFACSNGLEDNKDLTGVTVIEDVLYPLIAVIGEKNNASKIRLLNLAKPPEELTKKWEKENRWINMGHIDNLLVDNKGIMCNSSQNEDEGVFISQDDIDKEFTIKVLDKGNFGKIRIALSKEKEKDKEMQKQDSWIYQGVTGEVVSEKKTKYLVDPSRVETGDVLTVKFVTEDKEEKVVLFKNEQKIVETPFKTPKDNDMSILKLYIYITETRAQVQLMNYRPRYQGPVLFPNSLTVGRLHNLKILDDGMLIAEIPKKVEDKFYGCYMGKSPMNSECLSFEIMIEETLTKEVDAVAIGFCHSEIPQKLGTISRYNDPPTVFEICGGCVVFSSRGNVYAESQIPSLCKEEGHYNKGDKVKCEVEKSSSSDKLLFDEDGSISPQQDVNIKFYVNDKMVHQYAMTLKSDGLFPTIFTNAKIDKVTMLKILNFYPETAENRKKANLEQKENKKKKVSKQEKVEKAKNEPCPVFRDCEFLVVEIGKSAGKLQLVEEQLKGDMFTSTIENINKSIDYHEKNFRDLDIHGQSVYSTLCQAKEKIESLVQKPSRIKYMSMDITTGQGLDTVVDRLTDILDCRLKHQEIKYNLSKKTHGHMATVMETVKQQKIIEFGSGLVGFEEKVLKLNGRDFLQIAKLLHEQGKIALIKLRSKTVIADIPFLMSVMENLDKMSTMQLANKLTTVINESSHVWTTESAISHFVGKDESIKEKIPLLMEILQEYLGLIELPAWRQKPEDTQFIYTTLDSLNSPPMPLREFWSKGEKTKDFVIMQTTFSFIHSVSDHILSAVLSSATKYGRTLMMTSEGAVFQMGCVQTVVAKHRGLMDLFHNELHPLFDNNVISIESKCYIPDNKCGPVDELTEVYVKEYTWNIFCLYTDIIEKVLKQRNIVYIESGDAPKEFVNVSVGCKHNWKHIPGKSNQSICTMCNKCCDQGRKCKYNGIMGDNLRECLCKTKSPGCTDCGICVDCAADLWDLRSYLRPLPITAKEQEKKLPDKDKKNVDGEQKKVTPEETNNAFVNIPLDPVTFNEIECQHISNGNFGLILRDIDDGSRISVFPGKATTLAAETDDKKISDKVKRLATQADDLKYKSLPGNSIKLRITDPFKSITKEDSKLDLAGIQESRVVYHACICKELTVSHETGLMCYNSASSSVPVAQFIAPRPFSEKLKKLSIKIIDPGEKCNIGIGICPGKTYPVNRMPGWNRWSIAYHGDDGGIFIEAGFANSHTEKCEKGDVMSLFCDVVSRQLVFYRNEREVKQIKINVPRGGYWPMIGLHSVGECVKLLEKDAWTPEPEDIPPKPDAFNTYKYGNLWISPARNVSLTKKGNTSNFCGWVILHNPTKVVVGFKITPESLVKTPVGTISPQDAIPIFLTKKAEHKLVESFTIQWIAIEQVKEYTIDQILQLFDAASSSSTYTHKLGLLIKDTALGEVETLSQFKMEAPDKVDGEAKPVKQIGYKLDVFKNSMMVDSYLLKRGRYLLDLCDLDTNPSSYIINRPKCPSFLYPSVLQKGLRVVVKLDAVNEDDQFADAVISEVYEGGGYCLEYTPSSSGNVINEKICLATMQCGIEDEDWQQIEKKGNKEDMKIQLFSSPSAQTQLAKTFVPAPPHLITKGSAEVLEMIDPEWKKNVLNSFCSCSQSITRPTVQEQIVTKHSRRLLKWLSYRDSSLPYSVILLPSKLDGTTLKYPVAKTMFSDVSVHRLCFFQDGYIDMTKMPMVYPSKLRKYPNVRSLYDDVNIHAIAIHDGKEERTYPLKKPREVCLHMMDLPGFTVNGRLPVDISYGCLYQAWTYVALLTHKLLLPAYSQIFNGELGGLDRTQIQSLLFQLIQPYASLCSIYAAQYGGLSNQENPTYLSEKIQDMCNGDAQPIPKELLGKGMISNNHTFVSFPPFLACKAHSHSRVDRNIVRIPNLSLESEYYEPYSEKMDILMINEQTLKSLPSNLFKIFENLQVLSIMNVDLQETPEFPSGISRCKDLEIVCLSALKGVKKLSKDILSAPALSTFYLHNLPIEKLDIDWPVSATLTSLSLKGLLITKIPKEIGKLAELQELNLDCNPILTLPDELENLKKLKHFSAKGIPWIAFEGKFEQMPKQIYKTWHIENPYIVNYLSEKEVDDLFHRFDDNNNNILDPAEVAKLNFQFLTTIPRIGVQKLGDTVHGGVPEVIFKMKGLESLDLSYTGINCLPDIASELFTLQTLNLEHCPFLESVSGNLGLLPNLRSLHLNSCPLLETPPPDIVGRGFESIRAFLKKMAGGFTECHRTKLMFIGLGQAGKTTLLQALKSPTKKTQGTQDAKLTDGIEIKPWVVPVEQDGKQYDITYSCWDFAGQTVYYNTHQFFLSKQAVYMLLWNMRMGFEHAGLDFWLSSVACHCPNAPVIIVGTQLDQIPMPDIPEKELMRKYPQIKKFCYVSSTAGTNIPDLEQTLIDVTLNCCSQMKLKIPKVWLNFEESILVERKRGKNILEWNTLKNYAITNGIYDEKDIRLAVQFLDDLGTVQYFDTEVLRDRVVINPQWIVDVMAKVVSVNEKSIKENKGRFFHKFIAEIWKDYETNLHEWMLKLTERFDLTFPLPESKESVNVVPCLLPEEEPEDLPWPKIEEEVGIRESKIQYKFTYLPTGLFNRAQARLFSQGFTDNKLLEFLWKKGSILKKNNHYALVKQISDYEMIVTVQGPRPKNILDLIHETIITLIKDSFQGVDYDFYIPCPDCVDKEGTRDPFLFKAELISRAHNVNAPFLQCTKYFHTVSIGELMSILPDNRETEFDVQIQECISTLQEISSNMAKDVAILYSPEDIPTKDKEGEMVDPRDICSDLRLAGYNCWFPKDVNNTPELEMTLAIKNAKVLVVCMSDRFVRHFKCRQMFLYASEQLFKPYAIAVMDESLDWQSSDLGFKIGNPRMAMIKSVKRYQKKMEDLIDMIKCHILDIEKSVVNYPSVFISYCWANSHEACNNTTEAKEGSLGHGDPRALKKYLEKKGLQCWLDIEQMGKFGLYQDITVGLQNCKVLVVCVSDEYLQSEACMMEARFGAYNMEMPMVVCVVGTGKAWKMSEVSLMIQKLGDLSAVVKMQKESEDNYDRALACIRSYVNRPETEKQKRVREKIAKVQLKNEQLKKHELEKQLKQQGDTKFSFQEEIELIQRKFMRHISKITRTDDLENELPKLLVFDFVKKASTQKKTDHSDERESRMVDSSERPYSAQSLRPRTSKKAQSRDKMKAVTLEELEDDWQGEDFCIRVLCEDEQGWHLSDEPLSLISRTSEEIYKALKEAAPFLARIYAILKQSAINLNCLSSKKGENYLNYIRKEGIGTKNFSDAYKVIHKLVAESEDLEKFISTLNRCYLQSGKISWLCTKHQNKAGITQLQMGTSSIHGTARVLIFEEDNLLKDLVLISPLYLDRIKERTRPLDFKREKSTVKVLNKEKSDVEKKKDETVPNGIEEKEEEPSKKKTDKSVRISENPSVGPSKSKDPPSSKTRKKDDDKKNISFKTVGQVAGGVSSTKTRKQKPESSIQPPPLPTSRTDSADSSTSNISSSRSLTRKKSKRKQQSQACTIQ